jgi:hypothetical protein
MEIDRAARVVTPEFLSSLSDAELIALADAVGARTGEEFVSKGEREDAIERGMAADLTDDYLSDLLEASGQELARLPEEAVEMEQVAVALRGIGDRMDERDTSRTSAVLTAGVTALALLSRGAARARFIASPTPPPNPRIVGSFSQADLGALRAVSRQQLWWIGDLWTDHLSRTVGATVAREALVTGLGRVQVAEILRGVVTGEVPAARVPGTWPGSAEGYFEMLSGTVRNRSSNFGAISAMRDAGFTHYRIEAVMDERTSAICQEMDGQTFSIRDAEAHIARAEAATDPDEYKEVAGWRSAEEVRGIKEAGDLAEAGLALPPYHGRCRTTVIEEGRG